MRKRSNRQNRKFKTLWLNSGIKTEVQQQLMALIKDLRSYNLLHPLLRPTPGRRRPPFARMQTLKDRIDRRLSSQDVAQCLDPLLTNAYAMIKAVSPKDIRFQIDQIRTQANFERYLISQCGFRSGDARKRLLILVNRPSVAETYTPQSCEELRHRFGLIHEDALERGAQLHARINLNMMRQPGKFVLDDQRMALMGLAALVINAAHSSYLGSYCVGSLALSR